MAVAFSHHAAGHANSGQLGPPSNGTLNLTSVANGDTILFLALVTGGGFGLDSVSGCGAAWTLIQAVTIPGWDDAYLYVGDVGTASGSVISFGNSTRNVIIDAAAMSFTGATAGVISSSVAAGTNATVVCSTSDPFEADQAVAVFPVWFTGNGGSAAPTSYTDSPAFTTVDELAGSPNDYGIDSAYVITTGAGTYSRQANLASGGQPWIGVTALLSADPFPAPVRSGIRARRNQAVMRAATL